MATMPRSIPILNSTPTTSSWIAVQSRPSRKNSMRKLSILLPVLPGTRHYWKFPIPPKMSRCCGFSSLSLLTYSLNAHATTRVIARSMDGIETQVTVDVSRSTENSTRLPQYHVEATCGGHRDEVMNNYISRDSVRPRERFTEGEGRIERIPVDTHLHFTSL